MKNVGDFTLHSGKRTAIKKNGTLFCWFQYLKKLEVLALTNWSVALVFELWPTGQSTENQTKLYNFQTMVIFLTRKYLYYLLEWYTGWNSTLPTTLWKFWFSFILSFILSLTSTSPQNFQWLSSGCVRIISGTPGPWPLCQPKFEKNIKKNLAANDWIAEEPERWDWTSACKLGAILRPLQSMFWSHLAHPDRQWHKSDRDHLHRGLHPLLFSNNVMSPSNWSTRVKETRLTA